MWRGIVKVQRELAPAPDASMLITSELGDIYYRAAMNDEVLAWLGTRYKRYCRAQLVGTIIDIKISQPVPDQDW